MNTDFRVETGKRLVRIRGEATQEDFAKRLGVHKNTYGGYERGTSEIPGDVLRQLAFAGWNPVWVLTGEGPERLLSSTPPDATTDLALSVVRSDPNATARQESRFDRVAEGIAKTAPQSHSQPVRLEELTMALQLVDEALEGKTLEAAKRAELVGLVYEGLVEGLPEATVLRWARTASK